MLTGQQQSLCWSVCLHSGHSLSVCLQVLQPQSVCLCFCSNGCQSVSLGFTCPATSPCLYSKLPIDIFIHIYIYIQKAYKIKNKKNQRLAPFETKILFLQAMVLLAAWLLATKAQHSPQPKAAHLPETPRSLHQPRGGLSQWGCWGNPGPRRCSRGSSGTGPSLKP